MIRMNDAKDILPTLDALGRSAGAILLDHFGRLRDDEVGKKGRRDLLTVADRASEAFLIEEITRRFPDHRILAEESSAAEDQHLVDDTFTWIIDPLDGTSNFVHQLPHFAVSIGVFRGAEPWAACIHAPRLGETFLAGAGAGATLDGAPARVSGTRELIEAMMATGFAYLVDELPDDNLENFARVVRRTRGVRRCGSAALDLAYTACGRYDGFWELHLSPWDVAAGGLLVREAGGRVTDLAGGEDWLFGRNILATNGVLHESLGDSLLPFPAQSHRGPEDTA